MVRRLSALLLLLAWSASASAEAPLERFVDFTPLSLEALYEKRLRFEKREPIVSVGVLEGQKRIGLRADAPIRLIFEDEGIPRTLYADSGTTFFFRPLETTGAQLRHWTVVEVRPYGDAKGAAEARAVWGAQGFETAEFVTGTIMAMKGNVLDTRERRIGVGGFATLAEATALMDRLSRKQNVRSFIHTELLAPARGKVGVYDASGKLMHHAEGSVYFGTLGDGKVEVLQGEHETVSGGKKKENREYWGHIYVVIDRQGDLAAVNSIGTERLLAGVVPAEIFASAPLEALKAQAVTARGAIFAKLGHANLGDPFHICATQLCQVYGGASYEKPSTNQAVAETRGLLAVRPRKSASEPLQLVDSVYSSSSGGFTEANEVVWDNAASESLRPKLDGTASDPAIAKFKDGLDESNIRDWLESFPPTFSARSSFSRPERYRWKRSYTRAQLDEMIASAGIGRLLGVEILGRGRGGRVTGVRLKGTRGEKDILRELPVRRLFGNLYSGMFVLDQEKDPDGSISLLTFTGGGWGHGVGMCQMGAIGRAEHKQTFEQILAHYYNGAVVERIY